MEPGMRKRNAVSILRLTIVAESTTVSSQTGTDGTCLQRSEQAVARPSTPTVSVSSETVKVITAMCLALMDQTLSSDSMWLAMRQAEDMAIQSGVPKEQAEEIVKQVGRAWLARRNLNPLSSMF